jgi:DHA1 family inner membrane transport protein
VGTLLTVHNNGLMAVALAVWGLAYTALFPVCQVRVMKAGAAAQALAGTMNVSAANAGIGLGAIIGGAAINAWGVSSLMGISSVIAVLGIVVAVWMMAGRDTTPARAAA